MAEATMHMHRRAGAAGGARGRAERGRAARGARERMEQDAIYRSLTGPGSPVREWPWRGARAATHQPAGAAARAGRPYGQRRTDRGNVDASPFGTLPRAPPRHLARGPGLASDGAATAERVLYAPGRGLADDPVRQATAMSVIALGAA